MSQKEVGMEAPKSLTRERSFALLPKFVKRGKKTVLTWPKMSQEEANYILHLDSMFTYSEVASAVLGIANSTYGMQLVSSAERIGANGAKPVIEAEPEAEIEPDEED